MHQERDKSSLLSAHEIEAVKATQELIKRMADNSQKMKNFFLIACTIFIALIGRGSIFLGVKTCLALCLISIMFWFMDAKYLQLERHFRKHHNAIIRGAIPSLDKWNFDVSRNEVPSLLKTMFSFSELVYPTILISILLIG